MAYNEPRVFNYLTEHGHVYTVRHYPAGPPETREVRRRGRPTGDRVKLETVARVTAEDGTLNLDPLRPVASESGFESFEDWSEAIQRQHGAHLAEGRPLWLLKAVLVAPAPGVPAGQTRLG